MRPDPEYPTGQPPEGTDIPEDEDWTPPPPDLAVEDIEPEYPDLDEYEMPEAEQP
jgi:hypothetical protein